MILFYNTLIIFAAIFTGLCLWIIGTLIFTFLWSFLLILMAPVILSAKEIRDIKLLRKEIKMCKEDRDRAILQNVKFSNNINNK